MKIRLKKTSGSVLFTTLLTTGLICLYLGGYLMLVRNENRFTLRSQTWNAAIPVAEAGIEEAMTQLQVNFPEIKANNGWVFNGNYLMKTRKLNSREYYRVGIFLPQKKGATPTIVSEGFAQAPLSTNFISRTIRVNTKVDGTFLDGLVVVKTADMNGITYADSFDSRTNTLSTNGKYDINKRNDRGYIATLASGDSLKLTTVWGSIGSGKTDPGKAPSIKNAVGDKDWQKNGRGIQTGHYESDINITVQPWTPPFTNAAAPPVSTNKGGGYVLGTPGSATPVNYAIDNLTGPVTIVGNTRLLVVKSFNVNSLTIRSNATLELYVAAPSVDLTGNGQLNVEGKASSFIYIGLPANPTLGWPGNKTFDAGGNGDFTALVYAPTTDLILHGGGSSNYDFSGAALINTVTFKGNYAFHYDESAKNALARGYMAITWDEIQLTWDTILAKNLTVAQLY